MPLPQIFTRTPAPAPPPAVATDDPIANVPTAVAVLSGWKLHPLAPLILPPTDGLEPIATPERSSARKAAQAEMTTRRSVQTATRDAARTAVQHAETALAQQVSLHRLGEASADSVETARDAVAVAKERLADAMRDGSDAVVHWSTASYLETRERRTRNRPRQIEAFRRTADAYALVEQLSAQLHEAEARYRTLIAATERLTFIHPNPLDSPQSERAESILERVREHVRATLRAS